jgi:hypothetical protein
VAVTNGNDHSAGRPTSTDRPCRVDLRLPHANGVSLIRRPRRIDPVVLTIVVFSGTIASAAEVGTGALSVSGYVNEHTALNTSFQRSRPISIQTR